MAFEEVTDKQRVPEKGSGLPMQWDALEVDACPKCREDLVEFEHLDLWKCGCGFKISSYKKDRIAASTEARSNGYYFGNYDDEPPFA